jgi:hypothetical protein
MIDESVLQSSDMGYSPKLQHSHLLKWSLRFEESEPSWGLVYNRERKHRTVSSFLVRILSIGPYVFPPFDWSLPGLKCMTLVTLTVATAVICQESLHSRIGH